MRRFAEIGATTHLPELGQLYKSSFSGCFPLCLFGWGFLWGFFVCFLQSAISRAKAQDITALGYVFFTSQQETNSLSSPVNPENVDAVVCHHIVS